MRIFSIKIHVRRTNSTHLQKTFTISEGIQVQSISRLLFFFANVVMIILAYFRYIFTSVSYTYIVMTHR